MPTYKLHYFNARGLAEVSRLQFALAGVPFEDIRYEWETTWPAAKEKMPHGVVPVLEVDGVQLSQSFAIAKYLARTFGFNGSSSMEEARIDEIVEHTRDMMRDFKAVRYEQDETKKAALEKALKEEKTPDHLKKFEKILEKNNEGNGFFVGDKISLADLQVFDQVLSSIPAIPADSLAVCPKVKALIARIENTPGIKEWLEKRPQTAR